MNKIKSRIYYEKLNGNVLVVTAEKDGGVIETTKEEDMTTYHKLKDKNINDIDYIELEYGTLAGTFINVKSYRVNVDTKILELTYFTQAELDSMNQADQEQEIISNRTGSISEYLQSNYDEETLTQIEDLIIQQEFDKLNL